MISIFQAELCPRNDENRWKRLIDNALYASSRHSLGFIYSKSKQGREIQTYIFKKGSEDIGGAHYFISKYLLNQLSVADLISGFVFKKEPSKELLEYVVDHFLSWSKDLKASFISLNPWFPSFVGGTETSYYSRFNEVLLPRGFNEVEEGKHTYWLDLSKSEQDLLKNMNRKTRYEVRQGLKSDIRFTLYEKPESRLIDQFWDLYELLGKNKGFIVYPENKFKKEVRLLLETGSAVLFVASFGDTMVNMSLASNFGIASYLHGAINPDFKDLEGCPSPGQVAQWTMITEIKKRGAKLYDLGFCPGPVPVKSHPAYNIWRFKYGFGGEHVQFLPTYGKTLHPLKGWIFKLLRNK